MIPLFTLFFILNQLYEVEGVVVTAPRYPASLKDICTGTIVIDKETIENNSSSNLGELLKNLAGIDIRDYGNPGSVSSISIRGTPSSGVIVLLDGIPLNSIQTGIADISLIDVDDIEQIEIIKGPVSSLYGANGIGGVVNIITENNSGSVTTRAKIKQTHGAVLKDYHTSEYAMKYSIPSEHFDYRITGKKTSFAGGRTNNDYAGINLNNQIGYKRTDFALQFKTLFNHRQYGLPGPQPLIDSLHSVPYLGDSTSTSRFDKQCDNICINDLSMNLRILKNLSANSSFFANFSDNQYHTEYFFWDVVKEDYVYSLTTLGSNNSFLWKWADDKLIFGFDFRYDTLRAEKKSVPTGDTLWFAQGKNYGYWISLVKKFLNRWTANVGLRYDKNSSYGNFFSPSLGIVSVINERLLLKISLARAFRAPGFNDLYWPIYGNRNLKPEYGNAYELRLESSPVHNLFTGFSVFLREINNRITWLPTKDGLWKPQNVNYMRIAGLETEIHTQLTDKLRIAFDGTYLFARQRNREMIYYDFMTSEMQFQEIERRAAFIPSLTLSMKFDFHLYYNIFLHLSTDYTSLRSNYYENWSNLPIITMDTKKLNQYCLVNLSLRKKFFEHLRLTLGVKNLFDTSYAIQFGNSIDDKNYPMPRKTLFGEITWQ